MDHSLRRRTRQTTLVAQETSFGARPGRPILDVASTVVVWAAGAAVFFRAQLSTGFNQIMGDDGDPRLVVYLCEHWYLTLRGHESWRDPAFFYPLKDLLGWSDSLLLYEIFYAPLRLIGCDPFLSFQLTLVGLSAVGFASFVILVRSAFSTTQPIALFGALLFTFSNMLWQHLGSPQLLGVYLVPVILVFGVFSWRALPDHPGRSAIFASGGGATWALLFLTTYYVAWFSMLAGAVVVMVVLVGGRAATAARCAWALRAAWRSVAAAVAAFVAGIVPFALAYLPASRLFGGWRYKQVMQYGPPWRDLVSLGSGEFLWSGLVHRLAPSQPLIPSELRFNETPMLLTIAMVGGGVVAWRRHTGTARHADQVVNASVLAVTAAVLILLPVRISGNGSLWLIAWHLPGATAIRAIDRLQVVTGLVVSLTVVAAATELAVKTGPLGPGDDRQLSRRPSTLRRASGSILLLVAVVEQFNTGQASSIDRRAQMELLGSATHPPPACRAFFVADSGSPLFPNVYDQITAMLVSQQVLRPTVNGYTSRDPRGWELSSSGVTYLSAVAAWADTNRIRSGLCELNLATMGWLAHPQLPSH